MFFAEKGFMKTIRENSSFKKLFNWRSEIAFVAILAIAVLHFAFQFSFIRSENVENSRAVEFPVKAAEFPVKIAQAHPQNVETESAEIESNKITEKKKVYNAKPPKPILPVRERRIEIAPSKPQPKKKTPVESRAARLRRAEKILTGV
jgi:hypothetical protein